MFGIYNNYNKVAWGKSTIRLVTAQIDGNYLLQDAATEGEVDITNIELKIKIIHVFPNDEIKLNFHKQ